MPPRKDYDELMGDAHTTLTNAKNDPELQAVLEPVGYGPDKIDEGLALLQALHLFNAAQVKEYGEAEASTKAVEAAFDAAYKVYIRHVKFARPLFEDDHARYKAFGLDGKRAQDRNGEREQAEIFYTNVLADAEAVSALGEINIDELSLKAGQAAYALTVTAEAAQLRETGEAEAATVTRDKGAGVLRKWMRRFFDFAIPACEGHPQLLEKLGVVDPS